MLLWCKLVISGESASIPGSNARSWSKLVRLRCLIASFHSAEASPLLDAGFLTKQVRYFVPLRTQQKDTFSIPLFDRFAPFLRCWTLIPDAPASMLRSTLRNWSKPVRLRFVPLRCWLPISFTPQQHQEQGFSILLFDRFLLLS
jgi:hypothetical protein